METRLDSITLYYITLHYIKGLQSTWVLWLGRLGRRRWSRVKGIEGLAGTARRDADQEQHGSNSIKTHGRARCPALRIYRCLQEAV